MLDAYPGVTVVASKVALAYLKGLTHRPFTEQAVKGGDKVALAKCSVKALRRCPIQVFINTNIAQDRQVGSH